MLKNIENYFKTHKIVFWIFNIIVIAALLKIFQMLAYPETHYEELFTKDNLRFLFFGRPGEIGGLALTFILAIVSIILSFILGSIFGIARWSSIKLIKIPSILYIEIVRATPLLMVIFWVFFAIPVFSMSFFHTQAHVSPTVAAIIAFTIFTSAYVAEIVRAGINSIPKGQFEAAKSLGMNNFQTFFYIILPQAYRKMIPAFVSQFVALFKDTSLAYTIGVIEFFRAATIINNRLYISFEVFSFVALVYFSIAFSMSKFSHHLEKKVEKQLNA
ncbi:MULTISPECIES: amino acid ABC transporter permease [unclassified Lebetimonas]|uniref:amino acid ABC transporter permease n=1 Tax=unclassified Lebetimonas TaxID=2648158 RepID=UPI0004652CFD|nr:MULTISPECIES: amino acid ABC transporter permease [unclassified Lebetimonas]